MNADREKAYGLLYPGVFADRVDLIAAALAEERAEAEARIQRVRELLPRIEGVIEFDMAGERYDAVMSVQQVLEHLRRALDGA